ncbi:MAG: bifunctional 23S rRNA (guanine(2069)-N(7))-methyltransferase RlmK/23S rRNA (guanine(2445)-N(2))-methyltransferase RlmL, partial [Sphaerochaeta sp.]
NLPIHDVDLYEEIVDEVVSHIQEPDLAIYGWDVSPKAIRIAEEAAKAAGVDHLITFEVKDFTTITAEDIPPGRGVIVTDPPYGMRMGQWEETRHLYRSIGDSLSEFFGGWNVSLLTADDRLLGQIDLKPDRTNAFNNGGIPCTLAHYYIYTAEEKAELRKEAEERKKERLSQPLNSGAQMAYNRLIKNLKELTPMMEKEGVTNYRIYDADMIEYNAAIDLYENRWISLAEYAAPPTVDPEDAARRLGELIDATERATGVDRENIFVKQRTIQKGLDQYERQAYTDQFYIINENDARYLVNFTDYLDTGIFLDHRPIRKYISELTDHKRFLNLFCYTATATVQAAKGGALSTVSVDTSATYLDWAKKNMELNGFGGMNHFYYQSDSISFLWETYDRYDVIFCDPPTYSNSKSRAPFEVQRDHRSLIKACMMHLDPGGVLIFSCNYRSFRMDDAIYDEFDVEEITPQTIGTDYARDPKIHHAFLIRERAHVAIPVPKQRRVIRRKPID